MMAIPNFILVEDVLERIPQEHKKDFIETNWEDINFTTFSICDTALTEYEITYDGRFYRREEGGGLQQLDYTGDLEFGTVLKTEDKDYEITFRSLFFKGEMKDFSFLSIKELDRAPREEAKERIMEIISEQEDKKKRWWYKLYSVYCKVVIFTFTCIRWVFANVIKFCWFLQNKIT